MNGAKKKVLNGISSDDDGTIGGNRYLRLMGYSVRESAGTPAAAEANIVEGSTGSGGDNVNHIELSGDGSDHAWFGPDGIEMQSGISVNVVSGTIDLVLFYKNIEETP